MRPFLSKEELAVDKVYREEREIENNTNTENLLQSAKNLLSNNKDTDEDSDESLDNQTNVDPTEFEENNQQVDTSNSTNNYEEDSSSYLSSDTQFATGSSNMLNASGGEEDLNAGQEHLIEAAQVSMAIEELYQASQLSVEDWKDNLRTVGSATFTGVSATAGYLKNIGVTYGPSLLRAIGKTATYAVTTALKGLFIATKNLVKTIDNSVNGYNRLYKRLGMIQETIVYLEKSKIGDIKSPNFYENKKVIFGISNQEQFKPYETIKDYSIFLTNYVSLTTTKVQADLTGIRVMSSGLLTKRLSSPESIMQTSQANAGLLKGSIQGYKPPSDLVDVYHYAKALPGHMTLIAYLPKKDLTDQADIYTAYHQSQFFYGYNVGQMRSQAKVPYLKLSEAKRLHQEVLKTAKNSEVILAQLKNLKSTKDIISLNLKGLLNHITDITEKKNALSVNSRIIQYITLKMYFIQKCYTRSMIDTDLQNRKILFNYCRYIEASLSESIQNTKKDA